MHRVVLIVLASFLIACTRNHSHESQSIREIRPESAAKCHYLGTIDSSVDSGWYESDKNKIALEKLRNQAALMGGNAFVLKKDTNSGAYTLIQADVYKCQ